MSHPTDALSEIPALWRGRVEAELTAGETVLGHFLPDLTLDLQFAEGLILLTDRRLLTVQVTVDDPGSKSGGGKNGLIRTKNTASNVHISPWESWPITDVDRIANHEQRGLGKLELFGHKQRLEQWRYTSARQAAASRFVHLLEVELMRRHQGEISIAAPVTTICPSCGALLPPGETICQACAPSATPPASRSLMRLGTFMRPHWKKIVLGFLLMMASTTLGLVPPYLTMPLLDKVLIPYQNGQQVDFSLIGWYLGLLTAAAILAWLLAWARTYVLSSVSELIAADLRNRTYGHLQRLSLEFFGGKRTGDLMSRVGSDTDKVCQFLSSNLLDFITDLLMLMLTIVVLISINPLLALVTLLPLPLVAWLTQHVRVRLRHGFARSSRAWGQMTNVLADTIPGIRVVKAFAQEEREIVRFETANSSVIEANQRVNTLWSSFAPLVSLLTELGILVVWASGAYLVSQDHITVGMLTAFVAYISRFYGRLDSMSRMVQATQRAGAATHRIFEILDRLPSVAEPHAPVHPGRIRGDIELKNVSFQYGARRVIKDMNLHVKSGELIGLVGSSGAGKSTLVNLICRFYDVVEGAILVDGHDIRSFPVEEFRANIGIVLQEPFLFFGTIAENIAYGRPDASRHDVVAAARAAKAHDFILRLPDGYDSLVGERGQSLSGGERQRISIARAILTDPRILILDEATSSVDTETERQIQEALDNLVRGRTTLAIAHRLSTLRRADRLVVLDGGRIMEVGPHAELLAKDGLYARLHRAQQELAQNVGV